MTEGAKSVWGTLALGQLFEIRHNSVFTYQAHMQRSEGLKRWIDRYNIILGVGGSTAFGSLCLGFMKKLSPTISAVLTASGGVIFLVTHQLKLAAEVDEKQSMEWGMQWKAFYDKSTDLRNRLGYLSLHPPQSTSAIQTEVESQIAELAKEKKVLDPQSKTHGPSYDLACKELNRWWYEDEAKTCRHYGWPTDRVEDAK